MLAKQLVRRLLAVAQWEHLGLLLALLLPLSVAAQAVQDFSEVHIGAFDADAWNGIVFESNAYGQRVPFAIRIGSKTDTFLDGNRVFDAVSLVGPHAPDESYSLLGWRHPPRAATITLEWSRIDETTVVGRLKAPKDVQLVLEVYSPGSSDFAGTYSVHPEVGQINGEHFIDGVFGKAAHFVVAIDRPVVGAGLFSEVNQLQKVMDAGGSFANHSDHSRRATVVNVMKDGVRSASNDPLLQGIPAIPAGEKVDGRFFPLLYAPCPDGGPGDRKCPLVWPQ